MPSPRSPVSHPAVLAVLLLAAAWRPAVAEDVYVTNTSRQDLTLQLETAPPGGANPPVLASRVEGKGNYASLVELVNGGDSVLLPRGTTLAFLFEDRPLGQVPDFEQVVFDVVNEDGRVDATFYVWKVARKGSGAGATWRSIRPGAQGAGFQAADGQHLVITGER